MIFIEKHITDMNTTDQPKKYFQQQNFNSLSYFFLDYKTYHAQLSWQTLWTLSVSLEHRRSQTSGSSGVSWADPPV